MTVLAVVLWLLQDPGRAPSPVSSDGMAVEHPADRSPRAIPGSGPDEDGADISAVVQCVDGSTGEPIPAVQADGPALERSLLSDGDGRITLPPRIAPGVLELTHPGYLDREIAIPDTGAGSILVRLEPLGQSDFVTFRGSIQCGESLGGAPEAIVNAARVMLAGVHRHRGVATRKRLASVQGLRVPVARSGAGLWGFSVRLPVNRAVTIAVQARGLTRDSHGTYLGDEVYFAFRFLSVAELEAAQGEGRRLTGCFFLERGPQVFDLSVTDEGDAPLGGRRGLRLSLQHHAFDPPGLNFVADLRPDGNLVRCFGVPAVTRLIAQAPGFIPLVLPLSGSGLEDKIQAPAFLSLRLVKDPAQKEDACLLAILEAPGEYEPRMVILDPRRRSSTTVTFRKEGGDLWSLRSSHQSGGPFDLFVVLARGTIRLLGVRLVPGENRIDLPAPDVRVLRGRIARGGHPVGAATVAWKHAGVLVRETCTDSAGCFAIPGVPRQPISLEVTVSDAALRRVVSIDASTEVFLDLEKP